jgi:hypothetical protein
VRALTVLLAILELAGGFFGRWGFFIASVAKKSARSRRQKQTV